MSHTLIFFPFQVSKLITLPFIYIIDIFLPLFLSWTSFFSWHFNQSWTISLQSCRSSLFLFSDKISLICLFQQLFILSTCPYYLWTLFFPLLFDFVICSYHKFHGFQHFSPFNSTNSIHTPLGTSIPTSLTLQSYHIYATPKFCNSMTGWFL